MDSLRNTFKNIHQFRDARAWDQFHTPRNLAAALAIETSEIQELLLWKSDAEIRKLMKTRKGKAEIASELADVLIFALLLCGSTAVDPIHAIRTKLKQNALKYPVASSKGKATKYDRLGRRNWKLVAKSRAR